MNRMPHERRDRRSRLSVLLVLCCLFLAVAASAVERHALVVGINRYAPSPGEVAAERGGWGDLEGAVDDARAMASLLEHRFGFPSGNIRLLLDAEAGRDAVLAGLEDLLLERTSPGDLAVFYYAGHGSQVRNTSSDELDGMDETLVPADAWRGAPDIRDKELKRLLWQGLERGVRLTFVSDSCHSGSVTRGLAPPVARSLPPSTAVVDDPDDAPNPAAHPLALVLTATQPHQRAQEIDADDGRRGALTWALQRALTTLPPDASATDVFAAARSLMRWKGVTQDPTLEGRGERVAAPLFAEPVTDGAPAPRGTVVAVDGVEDGVVRLDGGLALGLAAGCVLSSVDGRGPDLRVVSAGLTAAEAVDDDGAASPEPGSLYRIAGWAPSSGDPLRLWIPGDAAGHSSSLQPVAEPTVTPPSHVLAAVDGGWRVLGSGVDVVHADIAAAESLLPDDASCLVLPAVPFGESLADAFAARTGTVELVDDPARADYLLFTDPATGAACWINRGATVDPDRCAMPRRTSPVPTDRATAAAALVDQAARLARIHAWHQLTGPGDDAAFPYRPAGLRGADGRLRSPGEPVTGGESLSLVLAADDAGRRGLMRLARAYKATPRHVYVFAVDQLGNGFPLLHEVFRAPTRGAPPAELVLNQPGQDFLVEVGEPYGTDTLFVLATEEPLPSMAVFDFEGVGVRELPARSTRLADLLYGIGERLRGEPATAPLNWSVMKVSVRSVAPDGS